jgi:hypothetical protein
VGTLSRQEALAVLDDGQAQLEALFDRLAPNDLIRPATIGGGDWSAKDLMGHIALCEEIALVTIDAWLQGRRPPIEETFTTRDTDGQNAWNQERKRSWPLEHVRTDSASTHRRLASTIERMTDQEWASPRAFEGDEREDLRSELGAVLGAPGRPFGHAFAHLPDLDAYVRSLAP